MSEQVSMPAGAGLLSLNFSILPQMASSQGSGGDVLLSEFGGLLNQQVGQGLTLKDLINGESLPSVSQTLPQQGAEPRTVESQNELMKQQLAQVAEMLEQQRAKGEIDMPEELAVELSKALRRYTDNQPIMPVTSSQAAAADLSDISAATNQPQSQLESEGGSAATKQSQSQLESEGGSAATKQSQSQLESKGDSLSNALAQQEDMGDDKSSMSRADVRTETQTGSIKSQSASPVTTSSDVTDYLSELGANLRQVVSGNDIEQNQSGSVAVQPKEHSADLTTQKIADDVVFGTMPARDSEHTNAARLNEEVDSDEVAPRSNKPDDSIVEKVASEKQRATVENSVAEKVVPENGSSGRILSSSPEVELDDLTRVDVKQGVEPSVTLPGKQGEVQDQRSSVDERPAMTSREGVQIPASARAVERSADQSAIAQGREIQSDVDGKEQRSSGGDSRTDNTTKPVQQPQLNTNSGAHVVAEQPSQPSYPSQPSQPSGLSQNGLDADSTVSVAKAVPSESQDRLTLADKTDSNRQGGQQNGGHAEGQSGVASRPVEVESKDGAVDKTVITEQRTGNATLLSQDQPPRQDRLPTELPESGRSVDRQVVGERSSDNVAVATGSETTRQRAAENLGAGAPQVVQEGERSIDEQGRVFTARVESESTQGEKVVVTDRNAATAESQNNQRSVQSFERVVTDEPVVRQTLHDRFQAEPARQEAGVVSTSVSPAEQSVPARREVADSARNIAQVQPSGESKPVVSEQVVVQAAQQSEVAEKKVVDSQPRQSAVMTPNAVVTPQQESIIREVNPVARNAESAASSASVVPVNEQSQSQAQLQSQIQAQSRVLDRSVMNAAEAVSGSGRDQQVPDQSLRQMDNGTTKAQSSEPVSIHSRATTQIDSAPISIHKSQVDLPIGQKLELTLEATQQLMQKLAPVEKTLERGSSASFLPETSGTVSSYASNVSSILQPTAMQKAVAEAHTLMMPNQVRLNTPAWNNALGERAVWIATQSNRIAEIKLDPPELGSLNVRVQINNDQVSLSFTSPHAHVRDAVEQSLPRLREMFAEQGLALQDSSVSDQAKGDNKGHEAFADQDGAGNGAVSGDSLVEGEQSEAVMQRASLSLVDYYA